MLDRIDYRILSALQADGRITNVELAQKVCLSSHRASGGRNGSAPRGMSSDAAAFYLPESWDIASLPM